MSEQYDIVIVGAGMVGLALANLLAQQGIAAKIAVIDHHSLRDDDKPYQESFDSRSTALAPSSVDILKTIGLWPAIADHATPIKHVQISDRGHAGWAQYESERAGMEALGYVVDNIWLGQQLIRAALNHVSIQHYAPAGVNACRPKCDGVELSLTTESGDFEIHAGLLVLADGAESKLARDLGIQFSLKDFTQSAIIANVEHTKAHQCCAYERFTAQGPLALLPLGEGVSSHTSALVWTHPKANAESAMALSESDFLAALQKNFGHELGAFTELSQRHSYPLVQSIAQEQHRSSLVLMGNAAHFLHPVAGQGFNLALRDCAELCAQLQHSRDIGRGVGDLSGLEAYVHARRMDQYATGSLSNAFIKTFSSDKLAVQVLRNMALLGLNQSGPIKSLFFEQMMGLGGRAAKLKTA